MGLGGQALYILRCMSSICLSHWRTPTSQRICFCMTARHRRALRTCMACAARACLHQSLRWQSIAEYEPQKLLCTGVHDFQCSIAFSQTLEQLVVVGHKTCITSC